MMAALPLLVILPLIRLATGDHYHVRLTGIGIEYAEMEMIGVGRVAISRNELWPVLTREHDQIAAILWVEVTEARRVGLTRQNARAHEYTSDQAAHARDPRTPVPGPGLAPAQAAGFHLVSLASVDGAPVLEVEAAVTPGVQGEELIPGPFCIHCVSWADIPLDGADGTCTRGGEYSDDPVGCNASADPCRHFNPITGERS